MTPPFDRRVTALRDDLAAASLRGQVESRRFAEGEPFRVVVDVLDMKRRPRPDAPLETQLLHGESLIVYDDDDGWGWAQAERDGYVGYVAMSALWRGSAVATHRVIVARTYVYPSADMKQPALMALPLDGRIDVTRIENGFARLRPHGFVVATHIAPIAEAMPDPVTVAERLVGVPYLWGGKSPLGIDCSGLVQLAMSMAGRVMPRDTDMQEAVGAALQIDDALSDLRRGDLVFWKGHVGLMIDGEMLLHANAHHMLVAREPLRVARDRILASSQSDITSIRRLDLSSI